MTLHECSQLPLRWCTIQCFQSSCLSSAFVGPIYLHCAPLQKYRAMLCTIDLRCAPPTCIVHHGAHGGPTVWVCGTYVVHHFNGAELHCAPPTCVVDHRHALCITDLHCTPWCSRKLRVGFQDLSVSNTRPFGSLGPSIES